MFRWLVVCVLLCGGAFYLVSLAVRGITPQTNNDVDISSRHLDPVPGMVTELPITTLQKLSWVKELGQRNGASPTTIEGARIVVHQKQEVGSDRDGQIVFFGTELKKGEEKSVPPRLLITHPFTYIAVEVAYEPSKPSLSYPLEGTPPGELPCQVPVLVNGENNYFYLDNAGMDKPTVPVFTRWKEGMPLYAGHVRLVEEIRKFRKLEEQDHVEKGDLLALIDPELALTDMRSKATKLNTAEADRMASEKTRDEAVTRVQVLLDIQRKTPGAVNPEEFRGAELNVVRYTQEELAKRAAVRSAEFDVVGAMKVVNKHEVRAAIPGSVKSINKNRGDSVKANQDTLLQIVNPMSLRAEALIDIQETKGLNKGQHVMLEVSLRVQPQRTMGGGLQGINAVAVNHGASVKGGRSLIIAAGEDKSLRGWDAKTGQEAWKPLLMPSAVRALACTPPGVKRDLLLVGSTDGTAHLFDLADPNGTAVALGERHEGPITAVAFSPDGTVCATASEDRSIILWSLPNDKPISEGKQLQKLKDAHRAAITSLAFTVLPSGKDKELAADDTSNWRLISAGRDNFLIVRKAEKGKPLVTEFVLDHRSGDVTHLGADGDRILFDSGKELRVLSLKDRQIEGTLRNPASAAAFSTLALFSPDGRIILTNGGSDGRPQLWRAPPKASADDPLADGRGSELRQLAATGMATCGAFDPAGQFVVTGTMDGKVQVWPMPKSEEIEKRIPATILLVEQTIDTNFQVRVWAELNETPSWLLPGSTATIVIAPEQVAK